MKSNFFKKHIEIKSWLWYHNFGIINRYFWYCKRKWGGKSRDEKRKKGLL